jgi:hypothetical protein
MKKIESASGSKLESGSGKREIWVLSRIQMLYRMNAGSATLHKITRIYSTGYRYTIKSSVADP